LPYLPIRSQLSSSSLKILLKAAAQMRAMELSQSRLNTKNMEVESLRRSSRPSLILRKKNQRSVLSESQLQHAQLLPKLRLQVAVLPKRTQPRKVQRKPVRRLVKRPRRLSKRPLRNKKINKTPRKMPKKP